MSSDTPDGVLTRDMELVRAILIWAEHGGVPSKRPGDETVALCYHVKIMIEAGLIEGRGQYDRIPGTETFKPSIAHVKRLTWQGHEVLDALRNDTFWAFAKKELVKHGMPLLFSTVVAWGKAQLAEKTGVRLQ